MKNTLIILISILTYILAGCKNENNNDLTNHIIQSRIDYRIDNFQKGLAMNPQVHIAHYTAFYAIEKKSEEIIQTINTINYEQNNLNSLQESISDFFNGIDHYYSKLIYHTTYDNGFELSIQEKNIKSLIRNKTFLINQLNLSKLFFYDDLWESVYEKSIVFNKLEPIIIPKKKTVKLGDVYESKIILNARDTTRDPTIIIGDIDYLMNLDESILNDYTKLDRVVVENGKGIYSMQTSSVGKKKYSGIILFANKSNEDIKIPFFEEFEVIK